MSGEVFLPISWSTFHRFHQGGIKGKRFDARCAICLGEIKVRRFDTRMAARKLCAALYFTRIESER